MPATIPADTALVRFRYTKPQPAGKPQPVPANSPPGTLPVPAPPISVGTEGIEIFKLKPPAHDIAEVERQWKLVNPFDGDKEWQDAKFIDTPANPPGPVAPQAEPDVDAQGVRHRAAGLEDLPGTVTPTEDAHPPLKKGKGVKADATAAETSDSDDSSPVSDTNADEAIESIGKMRSRDRLQHVIDNDKRTTVQDAARKRLESLGQ